MSNLILLCLICLFVHFCVNCVPNINNIRVNGKLCFSYRDVYQIGLQIYTTGINTEYSVLRKQLEFRDCYYHNNSMGLTGMKVIESEIIRGVYLHFYAVQLRCR